jgi:RNA polymerase sigma-70 factor, ECF subfamily
MEEKTKQAEELSLEALRAGDKKEIARLVDKFMDPVYRVAIRMTGNEQDAEDVTQETFIKVARALKGFEGRSKLSTWIYRIAINEALMSLRRRKPLQNTIEIDAEREDNPGENLQIVDWAEKPEEELLSDEGRQELDAAIAHLPENLRSVFTLRDLQDLSIEETAGILGISITNVKTRLLRARLKLRQELSIYYRERLGRENQS